MPCSLVVQLARVSVRVILVDVVCVMLVVLIARVDIHAVNTVFVAIFCSWRCTLYSNHVARDGLRQDLSLRLLACDVQGVLYLFLLYPLISFLLRLQSSQRFSLFWFRSGFAASAFSLILSMNCCYLFVNIDDLSFPPVLSVCVRKLCFVVLSLLLFVSR